MKCVLWAPGLQFGRFTQPSNFSPSLFLTALTTGGKCAAIKIRSLVCLFNGRSTNKLAALVWQSEDGWGGEYSSSKREEVNQSGSNEEKLSNFPRCFSMPPLEHQSRCPYKTSIYHVLWRCQNSLHPEWTSYILAQKFLCQFILTWRGCNSVVECPLRMRNVPGSNPGTSKATFYQIS